jgi:hypothetical protein
LRHQRKSVSAVTLKEITSFEPKLQLLVVTPIISNL